MGLCFWTFAVNVFLYFSFNWLFVLFNRLLLLIPSSFTVVTTDFKWLRWSNDLKNLHVLEGIWKLSLFFEHTNRDSHKQWSDKKWMKRVCVCRLFLIHLFDLVWFKDVLLIGRSNRRGKEWPSNGKQEGEWRNNCRCRFCRLLFKAVLKLRLVVWSLIGSD